jgi:hypothetical protein
VLATTLDASDVVRLAFCGCVALLATAEAYEWGPVGGLDKESVGVSPTFDVGHFGLKESANNGMSRLDFPQAGVWDLSDEGVRTQVLVHDSFQLFLMEKLGDHSENGCGALL